MVNLQWQSYTRRHPAAPSAGIQRNPTLEPLSAKRHCCLVVTHILGHRTQILNSTGQEELRRLRGIYLGEPPSPRQARLPPELPTATAPKETLAPIDNFRKSSVSPPSSRRARHHLPTTHQDLSFYIEDHRNSVLSRQKRRLCLRRIAPFHQICAVSDERRKENGGGSILGNRRRRRRSGAPPKARSRFARYSNLLYNDPNNMMKPSSFNFLRPNSEADQKTQN
ncbi:hypothetical protein DY000_02014218 [Brassica cretica]|uniref:DUF4005 domain-containing protein n=1 Tax=Brassica cretica TaxID=69181 RepID=A0ABQ7DA01_BRACR|nr:hypothetical protein DY000_02014218 [Brassica cretica]